MSSAEICGFVEQHEDRDPPVSALLNECKSLGQGQPRKQTLSKIGDLLQFDSQPSIGFAFTILSNFLSKLQDLIFSEGHQLLQLSKEDCFASEHRYMTPLSKQNTNHSKFKQIKKFLPNSIIPTKNVALTSMIFLLYLATSAACSPCNTITIAGCSVYDTVNSYNLADCGCLTCDPTLVVGPDSLSCCDSSITDTNCLGCDASYNCQTCANQYVLNNVNYHCDLCSSLITNCLTCHYTTAYQCTACSGTYVVNPAFSCVQCSDQLPNCASCVSIQSGCDSCLGSYVLNAINECVLCSAELPNCVSCMSIMAGCTTCLSTYGRDSTNQCVLCLNSLNNCDTCDSISAGCTGCKTSYLLNGIYQCVLCTNYYQNCIACTNSGCTSCQTNYTLALTTCTSCLSLMSNCLTCTSPTTCTKCDLLYGVDSNSACTLCGSVLPYCSYCSSIANNCTVCNQNYGQNADNQCESCGTYMPGCAQCLTIFHPCRQCWNGHYWNDTLWECPLCSLAIYQCGNCKNSTLCYTCNSRYGFNSSNGCEFCHDYLPNCSYCLNTSLCTGCIDEMAFDDNRVCVECHHFIPYCRYCHSSRQNCTLCNVTYMGANYEAVPNYCDYCNVSIPHCSTCTWYKYCTKCINTSYILVLTNWTNQNCTACSDFLLGCDTCTNTTNCKTCSKYKFLMDTTTNNSCVYCSAYMPYCSTCLSTNYCLTCQDRRYALTRALTAQYCMPCSSLMTACIYCESMYICTLCLQGKLLSSNKGCSVTAGCTEINTLAPVTSNCLACDTNFFFRDPNNYRCICYEGWPVGQYCTTIIGCISVTLRNNKKACINCDVVNKFVLKFDTCECLTYYRLQGNICVQICGDGRLISLQCDDGNTIDGDGCSSICQIQSSYVCKNDYKAIPATTCKFQSMIQLKLDGIHKTAAAHQAEAVFNILPFTSKITMMDLMALVKLQASGVIIQDMEVQGKQLVVTFVYDKDIQGETASININFDELYIISPNFAMNFTMVQSDGILLLYKQQVELSQKMILMVKILSFLTLGTFVVGSMAYKMIGVETIFTMQTIWILQVVSKFYKNFFAHFDSLNYTYGQLSLLLAPNDVINTSFGKLGFTNNFLDSYLLFLVINGCLLIASFCLLSYLAFLKIKVYMKTDQFQDKLTLKVRKYIARKQAKIQKVSTILTNIYNWALFPIFIGFMPHFIHSILVNELNRLSKQLWRQEVAFICLIFLATSYIYFFQIINHRKSSENMLKNSLGSFYIPYFLIHNIVLIFFLLLMLLNKKYLFLFNVIIVMVISHLIFIIIRRPYILFLHNFSLIINQLAILLTMTWIYMKDRSVDYFVELLIVYVFLGITYAVILFALLRSSLILWRMFKKRTSHPEVRNDQQTKENQKDMIEDINLSRLRCKIIEHTDDINIIPLVPTISQNKRKNKYIQKGQSGRNIFKNYFKDFDYLYYLKTFKAKSSFPCIFIQICVKKTIFKQSKPRYEQMLDKNQIQSKIVAPGIQYTDY